MQEFLGTFVEVSFSSMQHLFMAAKKVANLCFLYLKLNHISFHYVDLSKVNFKPKQGNSGGTAIFGGILHPKPSNIKHLFPVVICENFQLY